MSKKIPLIKSSSIGNITSNAWVEVCENKSTKYSELSSIKLAYSESASKIKQWILANNLVVLAGAGTSMTTNDDGSVLDNKQKRFTGKSVSQIWNVCKESIEATTITQLQKLVGEPEETFQLERFMSKIEMYSEVNRHDSGQPVSDNVKKCAQVRAEIIKIIKSECDLRLHELSPHTKFLRSLMIARNSSRRRLQLYTLNYDTLFEQAGESLNATIVDGFSFTRQPTFHGSNFELDIVKREKNRVHDQENYEEKVFQLYKLHGSLDWEFSSEKNTVIRLQQLSQNPVIIPPSNQKFEQSYQMPFFEMMSRFQQTLRGENTVLIVIGYSFSDLHINRVILEAIESNLNFELVVISPTVTDAQNANEVSKFLNERIENKTNNNITLISDTFQRFMMNFPALASSEEEIISDREDNDPAHEDYNKEEIDESIPF